MRKIKIMERASPAGPRPTRSSEEVVGLGSEVSDRVVEMFARYGITITNALEMD